MSTLTTSTPLYPHLTGDLGNTGPRRNSLCTRVGTCVLLRYSRISTPVPTTTMFGSSRFQTVVCGRRFPVLSLSETGYRDSSSVETAVGSEPVGRVSGRLLFTDKLGGWDTPRHNGVELVVRVSRSPDDRRFSSRWGEDDLLPFPSLPPGVRLSHPRDPPQSPTGDEGHGATLEDEGMCVLPDPRPS